MFKKSLPLLIFLVITILLWRGLALHPNQIPSPLISKPAPDFQLPLLFTPDKTASNKDFLGHVTLFNIWASWCYACAEEHTVLLQLAQQEHIIIYGLNYKDNLTTAKKWLHDNGNPYQLIAVDQAGTTAIDWGVYGTPETFIIDKKGMIRYKQIGAITLDSWQHTLKPLVQQLESETT